MFYMDLLKFCSNCFYVLFLFFIKMSFHKQVLVIIQLCIYPLVGCNKMLYFLFNEGEELEVCGGIAFRISL